MFQTDPVNEIDRDRGSESLWMIIIQSQKTVGDFCGWPHRECDAYFTSLVSTADPEADEGLSWVQIDYRKRETFSSAA